MHSAQPTAMESDKEIVMIPRLSALMGQADLRKAILETIQKMGYDRPSENQAFAINHFVRGNDLYLLAVVNLSAMLQLQEFLIA